MPLNFDRKSIALCFLVIYIFWLPWVILHYPCGMSSDTVNQLYQYTSSAPTFYTTLGTFYDAEFIDHHPVFDTLVFGFFYCIGDTTEAHTAGLFAYSLIMSILTALILAVCLCYLSLLKVPHAVRLALMAFVIAFPPIVLNATTMLKDPFFSTFYLLFFLLYIEAFRTRGAALKRISFLVGFILVSGLCILTLKLAPYLVIGSLLLLLITSTEARKRVLLTVLVTPLIFIFAFQLAVYPAIGGVQPGGKQESYGVFFQQAVTVLKKHYPDVTEEEYQAVNKVVNVSAAKKKYNPHLTDPVKNAIRRDATDKDFLEFIRAYISIGLKHPYAYFRSIAGTTGMMYAPGMPFGYRYQDFSDKLVSESLAKLGFHFDVAVPEGISNASYSLWSFTVAVQANPLIAIVFSLGLVAAWIPVFCFLLSAARDKRYWICYSPVILFVCLLSLHPASGERYVLPMLYTTVLTVGLMFSAYAAKPTRKKSSATRTVISNQPTQRNRKNQIAHRRKDAPKHASSQIRTPRSRKQSKFMQKRTRR